MARRWQGGGWRPLLEAQSLGNAKPQTLGQSQLCNLQGPVQNENAGPFVQKTGKTFLLYLSLSQPVVVFFGLLFNIMFSLAQDNRRCSRVPGASSAPWKGSRWPKVCLGETGVQQEERSWVEAQWDIVPLDFTYKTQTQRQNYEEIKMVTTEN